MSKQSKAATRREEKRIENEQKIKNAQDILSQLLQRRDVPRPVLREIRGVLESLGDTRENPGIRAANAVSSLEGLTRDSNGSAARVALWSAMSVLEGVRES
jgi:uncharacterized protein (UPF0147 family)